MAGPGYDAAVVRIKETGTSVAMSLDGNGRFCSLDPRQGTKLIVAECCRNLSTVGALPIATTNNLNFGNPERPEIMAQIVESIEGLAEACRVFEVPVTGGNVSLYNETLGTPILPTPVVGIVGVLPTSLPVSSTFTQEGQTVILLGGFGRSDWRQLGGTQYAKVIEDSLWGVPPELDMDYEKRVHQTVRALVRERVVSSAHDVGEGGLAVALAESSFGPAQIGADVELTTGLPSELALFHEGPSRILVATDDRERVMLEAKKNGIEALAIGVTVSGILRVSKDSAVLIDASVPELFEPWSEYLGSVFQAAVIA